MTDERDPGSAPAEPSDTPGVARGDRVHAFRTPEILVTWSRARCTHVAACVMNLPAVFEPGRRPWVDASRASADAVARTIARCPTGALHFVRLDGGAAEPVPDANTVRVTRDGPVHLRGRIEVRDEAGSVLLRDTRVALCRCGFSKTKPLCDNAHQSSGFREAGDLPGEHTVKDPGAPDATLRVTPLPNASVELTGAFELQGAGRGAAIRGTSVRLCRCGRSATKPFCDGSHERVGFRSA